MLNVIDRIFWFIVWGSSAGCWVAVSFFDWHPASKMLEATTFLALQFAASAKLDLFYKVEKP